MAFGITVHRRTDDSLYCEKPEVGSEAFDAWINRCQAHWVYENPLGADGTVYEMWHAPALELGLRLLGSIYHYGLRAELEQLASLGGELDILEAHWAGLDLSPARPLSASTFSADGAREVQPVSLAEHLRERLGYLREAIRVAVECDGVLEIG